MLVTRDGFDHVWFRNEGSNDCCFKHCFSNLNIPCEQISCFLMVPLELMAKQPGCVIAPFVPGKPLIAAAFELCTAFQADDALEPVTRKCYKVTVGVHMDDLKFARVT